jgi:biopolymer transport protein ExbB
MQYLERVQLFIEQGGSVIWAVFVTCFLLWALILERFWFFKVRYPRHVNQLVAEWNKREDFQSWHAQKIRESIISENSLQLHTCIPTIQTLIMLCPMLGLLGTVTGMVGVFEVIGFNGSNDAESMAQGVYRATIPTMAGLVVALSGLYFATYLKDYADSQTEKLADRLMVGWCDIKQPLVE